MTSSLRTKDSDDESSDPPLASGTKKPQHTGMEESSSAQGSDDMEPVVKPAPQVKEILLCLRPIRDGDGKTDEANRFKPYQKKDCRIVSEDNRSSEATTSSPVHSRDLNELTELEPRGHKRAAAASKETPPRKKPATSANEDTTEVAESLMSMSSSAKKKDLVEM